MNGRRAWSALALLACTGCVGTGEARYVYQDGQFGVVGIPRNSSDWPHDYRAQAERLMAAHFPDGFEIVRAEEVVEGTRTLTTGGSGSVELGAEAAPVPLKLGRLGRTVTRSQADQVKVKECRIIYKRADGPAGPNSFAEQVTAAPELYVDPNAAERRRIARGEPAEPVEPTRSAKGEKAEAGPASAKAEPVRPAA